ncbi:MarR family transcriptional regulator [Alkalicoccus luteus]|uniref:MarR family transcriptional regulator n=1 Tax=Alkalicoccus luteus TaxID=1237094 RepID=A0A969TVE1_9BACI|nr:MarR family transcriptional regulator [Alkalicoccus luteus]NJP36264.1 MarR family transcriptional regulator [Alkalicoccus luteus]
MAIRSIDDYKRLPEAERQLLEVLSGLPDSSLDEEAVLLTTSLYTASRKMVQLLEQQQLVPQGLSWTAFSMLYDCWISSPRETWVLAESAGVSKATASTVIKRLAQENLCQIQRDPSDRRRTRVELTEAGKQLMRELYPVFHEQEKTVCRTTQQRRAAAIEQPAAKVN